MGEEDWSRVADRAEELLGAIESARDSGGRTVRELFADDALQPWDSVRDALCERDGGIVDLALALAGIGGPPRAAARQRPWGRISTAAEHFARTMVPAPRRDAAAVVLAVHGGACGSEWPLPADRWSSTLVADLPAGSVWISLFPPARGRLPRRLAADLRDCARGTYVPWQAGLRLADWRAHVALRRAYARELARLWGDPIWRGWAPAEAPAPQLAAFGRVFIGLARDLALARTLAAAAHRLLGTLAPRWLISCDALGNAGRAFGAAIRPGGQVAGVQAGIVSPTRLTNFGFRRDLGPPDAVRPDRMLVWSERDAELLREFGWDRDELLVAGFPAGTQAPASTDRGRPRVLAVATGNVGVSSALAPATGELELLEGLADACARLGALLVVRPHPTHRGTDHERRLARVAVAGGGRLEQPGVRIAESLACSTAVLAGPSTALLESLRFERPTGLLQPGPIDVTGLAQLGLPVIADRADADAALRRLLAEPAPDRALRERVARLAAPAPPAVSPLRILLAGMSDAVVSAA